ncbi:LLM class flavin-dependent oxidoreductase [Kineosporia sp. J2-2]|uniref:LLM class flavin-dependent oxidoreductase n=1 Tax=Kineosporia corallincola TaxID=2835133 RepID=A0ABS5TAS3_9ACTN|nr:LLM class flavin-dependent oxidoreductase [Kineosporia corallincola]MBT0768172.1 LLM class flavin-dependent oxidoreductase [Kineosporia corallincola]
MSGTIGHRDAGGETREKTDHSLVLGIGFAATDPTGLAGWVRTAELIGLGFVVLDDVPDGLDPVESAAFAGAGTRSIALVAHAPATHAEPFHLSNQFSGLDRGTNGRAGWLVSADAGTARARARSAPVPDPATARREAVAVVGAARRLWDSWEDGALIADSASGRFLDADRIHYVDVDNEFFSIRGPALMPRPVQGQVVVISRYRDQIGDCDVVLVGGAGEAARARAGGASRVFAEIAPSPGLLTSLRRLTGHVDGVLVRAADPGAALHELGQWVVPALAADGVLRSPEPGGTFRELLGLPRPVSRYATSGRPA